MELWDTYDFERNKLGNVVERGKSMPDGEYRIVVHVCIFNSKNEMLIQHRTATKEVWPDYWDVTAGGSAIAGEKSWQAIGRELKEELGIEIDFNKKIPNMTFSFNHGFDDVYLVKMDVDISKLKLQEEEVQDVKWASKEEILQMIESGEFIPYYGSAINLYFDTKCEYSIRSTEKGK